MISRKVWKTVGLTLAPLLVLFARPALAQTTIDFETLSANTPVKDQYPGVTFNGAGNTGAHISAGDVTAHNGSNVLIVDPVLDTSGGGPLTFTFAVPQKTVSLWASYVLFPGNPQMTTLPASLTAFDQSGAEVPGASVSGPVVGGMVTTQLAVSSQQAVISKVTLTLGQGVFTVIDDLTFGGGAIVTPPSGPGVTITAPADGATIDVTNGSLAVTGSVSGQNLPSNVTVTLTGKFNAPNQAPPVVTTTLQLDATQAFSGPNAFTNVPTGIYTVTVSAMNQAGENGSTSVTVNNFPTATGVIPSEFQYSQVANGGECHFIAYNDTLSDRAVAFFPATNGLISVDRQVLQKWQHVNDLTILHGDGTLGCPLIGEVSRVETAAMVGSLASVYAYRVAPFERGSIYWVSKDQGATNIFPPTYTPKVFANAINLLSKYSDSGTPVPVNDAGGIDEFGIPVADPTFDLSAEDPTFLFQQFARPWYVARDAQGNVSETPGSHAVTAGVPNTLEIRGLAPTLYVERIGGSFLDYKASFHGKSANCQGVCNVPVPGDVTPTVWQTGGCFVDPTSLGYECVVEHPFVQGFTAQTNTPIYSSAPAVPNFGGYCDSDNTAWLAVGITLQEETEWSAIPGKPSPNEDTNVGDLIDIQELGWVIDSNKSSADFPATHEHIQGTADGLEDLGSGQGCVLGAAGCLLGVVGYQLGGHGAGLWSDYDIHVRPLALSGIPDPNKAWVVTPASGTLPAYWNLLASNGDPTVEGADNAPPIGDIETEWEEFWQHSWVSVSGGSPIPVGSLVFANGRWMIDCGHPPQHSEIHPPNTLMYSTMKTNTILAQNVVTTAQMWVNEFYEGIPYQTQVWPPPRPTPTATMVVINTTYGFPTAGPVTNNSDGSRTYAATPSAKKFDSLPPETPAIAQATVSQHHDGLLIQVDGPKTNHDVHDTGQVIYPDDHPDTASGPISNLYATWTVGWKCETTGNGTADCQTPP